MTASDAGSVLITGGAGFMGSALVRQWLADEPAGVVNIDKLTYAGLRESLDGVLDHPRHLLVPGDIADAALVRSVLVEHRPRAILHLAAETHVDRSIVEPPVFARTNVLGTCVLLDAATSYWKMLSPAERAAFRFLYVSTDEVFGSAASGEAFTASSPLQPNSPYAASKAAGEQMTFAFARTYGLPAVVVNPSNNYGPRQMPEKLIPKMILAAARLEALPVYGDGLQERDWIHVDDCCRAIRIVLRKGNVGHRYLIGSGECRTNLSVVAKVCELVDQWLGDGAHRHALVEHVSDRPGHDRRYLVDSGPLRRELGWRPLVDFGEGLVATVDWYLKASDWISAAESSLKMRESLSLG